MSTKHPTDWSVELLAEYDERICELAKSEGLDWYPIQYEVCDYYSMIGHMSYHGMPTSYGHWSFGKAFERTHQMYNLGAEGLPYELIINSNPSIAYLMKENPAYLQILIMAHCVGHSDFFKNNRMFKDTRPETVIQRMRNAKKRVQAYTEDPYIGIEAVEEVLDAAHALQFQMYRTPGRRPTHEELKQKYVELINSDEEGRWRSFDLRRVPLEPEYDLLGFIRDHGKLEDWKVDLIDIVRDGAAYFLPQIQTKVMNEGWACVTGDTLIDTDQGLITARELVENRAGTAFDGAQYQKMVDWHYNPCTERVKITTNLGYTIHGSKKHRVWDGRDWVHLGDIKVGYSLPVSRGDGSWTDTPVMLDRHPKIRVEIDDICRHHGVTYRQVGRWVHGLPVRASLEACEAAKKSIDENKELHVTPRNKNLRFPSVLSPQLSNILGLIVGDGGFWLNKHSSRVHSGLTTGDDEICDLFCDQVEKEFGIRPNPKRDTNKWRIGVPSEVIVKWLIETFDFDIGNTAAKKKIPRQVLVSPREVVAAFIRGLFDADACATTSGNVIYVTASRVLAQQVHEVLLKFGIASKLSHRPTKNPRHSDGYRIEISGVNADTYRDVIGFNLTRKQARLERAAANRQWRCSDRRGSQYVVDIEYDVGEVFDFEVENTHKYRASSFMNHNSFHHYRLCHKLDLPQEYHIPFLKSHNQVLRPHIGGLNPYHIGFEVFKKIEERYGIDECFIARETCNDVSFLRQYLREEDMRELGLFSYSLHKDEYKVDDISDEDGWDSVKSELLRNIGGNSIPVIYVEEMTQEGVLVLRHEHDGRDLELNNADQVVEHTHSLWESEVKMFTIVEGEEWEI
jgi:stage V sporulation protein R